MYMFDATVAQIEALELYRIVVITETRTVLTCKPHEVGSKIVVLQRNEKLYECRVVAIQRHDSDHHKQLMVLIPVSPEV